MYKLPMDDEHQSRVNELISQLNELKAVAHNPSELNSRMSEICHGHTDTSLLRVALISMVIHAQGDNDWRMSVIADIVNGRQSLTDVMTDTMQKIRTGMDDTNCIVRQMTDYAKANYSDEYLSLEYLADHVIHMNADYIGRLFSRTMGKKFSNYLLEVRMEHAKLLMRADTSLYSYEVAERVGMGSNPHYFVHQFRKYIGMTTREFRKKSFDAYLKSDAAPDEAEKQNKSS